MSTHPTTFADLEAAGWTPGAGASGYRRRYTTVGAYDVGAFSDGGGVYVERTDGAHHIDTADACALAARIAALISGDINAADAALEEAHATNARLAGELAQAQVENAALRARLAERPAPPDPRDPPLESEVEACWALLEEDNPDARKWGSLNGALQNTLINLRSELRRAEGQLARAKAKAHTLLDEAIEGEDGA